MCIVLLMFKSKWKRNVFAVKRKRDGDELAQITAETSTASTTKQTEANNRLFYSVASRI